MPRAQLQKPMNAMHVRALHPEFPPLGSLPQAATPRFFSDSYRSHRAAACDGGGSLTPSRLKIAYTSI